MSSPVVPMPPTHVKVTCFAQNIYVDREVLHETLKREGYVADSIDTEASPDTRNTKYTSPNISVDALERAMSQVGAPPGVTPDEGDYDRLILTRDVPELVETRGRDTFLYVEALREQCDAVQAWNKRWESMKRVKSRRILRADAQRMKRVLDEFGSVIEEILEETKDLEKTHRGFER